MSNCEISIFSSKQTNLRQAACIGPVKFLITQEPLEALESISVARRTTNLVEAQVKYSTTQRRNLQNLGVCQFTLDDSINTADTSFYRVTIPKNIKDCSQFSINITEKMLSFFDNKFEIMLDDKDRFVVQLGDVVPDTGFSNPTSETNTVGGLAPQYIILIAGLAVSFILVIVWYLIKRRDNKIKSNYQAGTYNAYNAYTSPSNYNPYGAYQYA